MKKNNAICKQLAPENLCGYLDEMFLCAKNNSCNSSKEFFPCNRIVSALETATHFWEYYMGFAWKKTIGSYTIIALLLSTYFGYFFTNDKPVIFVISLVTVGVITSFYSYFLGINGKFLYLSYLKHVRRLEVFGSGRVHGIVFAYQKSTPHMWKTIQLFSLISSIIWLIILYYELSKTYSTLCVIVAISFFCVFTMLFIFIYKRKLYKNKVENKIESFN